MISKESEIKLKNGERKEQQFC